MPVVGPNQPPEQRERQAALALIVTAPVLLLTLLMPKEIVAELTAGGVIGG